MNANVSKLLNEQINKEFYSAYLYLDFANYYACLLYTSIVYASMYGNTENAAQALAAKLCDKGMSRVALYDVSSTQLLKAEIPQDDC